MAAGIAAGVVFLLILIVLIRAVRIVPQAQAAIVERLGRYHRTLSAGLAIVLPFIDRLRVRLDMREQVVSFPPQPVITEDNLVVSIDTVVYHQVNDPRAATYESRELHLGDRAADGDDTAQRDRRPRPGRYPDQSGSDQRAAARRPRRGHRQVGHPCQPRRTQGNRPAARRCRRPWRSRCAPNGTSARQS